MYKNAKYLKDELNDTGNNHSIQVLINDHKWFVPIAEDNTDYIEIMRQVDAGELTIEPADE